MIVNHTTGTQITLAQIRRQFTGIAQTANVEQGIRTPWADESNPTDSELRVLGYSYRVDAPRPTLGEGEQVRQGPDEYDAQADVWRQTWIVERVPVYVPEQVYGHQMRAVLRSRAHGQGTLWDVVLTLVAGLPEPQRTTVDDSLRTAAVMRRDSPSISAFAGALGLDSDYVDGLFIEADGVRV